MCAWLRDQSAAAELEGMALGRADRVVDDVSRLDVGGLEPCLERGLQLGLVELELGVLVHPVLCRHAVNGLVNQMHGTPLP